jgi:prephenate dehydrogenase
MPINVSILGLDIVGGSLGLSLGTLDEDALANGRPIITGWDRNNRVIRDARDRLLIDKPARDIVEAVRDADVIFVTAELADVAAIFAEIAPHLKHGAIVSDASSAKTEVLALAQRSLPTTVDFIGGDPMVQRSGSLKNASADLFKGIMYCLVPSASARPTAIDTVAALVEAIGAKPYYIDAAEHDSYIASVRHIPLLLSAALLESVSRGGGWRDIQPIAGESFRFATQLAAGDPAVHAAECVANSEAIALRIDEMVRLLGELRNNLNNAEQLEATLAHANEAYNQWLTAQPNLRPGEKAFYGDTSEAEPVRGINALFFGQRKRSNRK